MEGIEGGGHGVDGGGVDVVGEDDGAGGCVFDDVAGDMVGLADFPVLGIDRPEDDAEAVFVVKAFGEGRVDVHVGGTHGNRADACGFFDGFVRLGDLRGEGGWAQFGELRVAPAVVGDFVAFVDDALGDVGILGDAFSNNEEGGLDVALFEYVEEAWGEFGMRAVIEGHGNDGTFDIATGVGVLSRGGCGECVHRSFGRGCGDDGGLGFDDGGGLRGRGMRRELGFGGRIGCEADNEGEESEGCGESDGGSDRKSHTDAGR